MERVVGRIIMEAGADHDWALRDFSEHLRNNMRFRKEKFVAYRKVSVLCVQTRIYNGLQVMWTLFLFGSVLEFCSEK